MSSSSRFPNPSTTSPDSQSVSYQTHVSAGHKKFQVSFSFSGILEEVVLTMSHCLTALNPKLLGYSVTSNILLPAPTTHGEWPGKGRSAACWEEPSTKRSLIPCTHHKGSTHIRPCQAASSASGRSGGQRSGGNFTHFLCCMAQVKGCRTEDTTARNDGGFFSP